MTSPGGIPGPGVRGVLRHYGRIADVKPWHVVFPLALALLVGLVEGGSFTVLIPLSDGVAAGDFSTLLDSRWLGWVPNTLLQRVAASPQRDAWLALLMISFLFGLRFVKLGLDYARTHFLARRDERYRSLVREETFARILSFGRQYFDRQALGHLDSEISWSTSSVRWLSASESLVMESFRLAVKSAVVMVISPILFVALMGSLYVIHRLMDRVSTAAGALAAEAALAQKRARREVLDLLGTIPLVKAHTQEARAQETYREILRDTEDIQVRRARLAYLNAPIEEGVVLLGALVAEGLILLLFPGSPALHLARFCAFFLVALQCLPDLKAIASSRLGIVEQIPRLEALARLFEDDGKFIVQSGPRPFEGVRQGIEVRGLHFSYNPDAQVLTGIDATFPAGRVSAIVGRSGAGKTTLVDLIARLYDCPPGTIFVDGVDIREFDLESLHRRLAIVSQDVWLLNRTVRDNLTFGLAEPPSDAVLLAALDDVGLRHFFEDHPTGLDSELGDRGIRLSGGQRQRIALARTLLREPEILILDEATSALDSAVEGQVLEAIERRLSGRTIIVIAHRLSTLKDADRIQVLDGGRVVECDTWERLVARGGTFTAMHQAQFGDGPAMAADAELLP